MIEYTENLGKVVMTAGGEWSNDKEYDILTMVHEAITDRAYISRTVVPVGVDISDSRFWMPLNVSGYVDTNVIVLSKFEDNGVLKSYTLDEAIKSIAIVGRKAGAILCFYNNNYDKFNTPPSWEIYQFNSTDISSWENTSKWVNIYYNYNKFVGWYLEEDSLKLNYPKPNAGMYAYVGKNFVTATVYVCKTSKWENTNQVVKEFVSINITGETVVGENGHWWQNGIDTGIPAYIIPVIKIEEGQILYTTDNVNWIPLFKILQEFGNSENDVVSQRVITAMNTNLVNNNAKLDINNEQLKQLNDAVKSISVTGGASTASAVTFDNTSSGMTAVTIQGAIEELKATIDELKASHIVLTEDEYEALQSKDKDKIYMTYEES
nr:MAG TPA: hypothetical protein [Crassvirales sp.]